MGSWYEIKRIVQPSDINLECGSVEYYLQDNDLVRIVRSGVDFVQQTSVSINGYGVLSYPNEYPPRGLMNHTYNSGKCIQDEMF